MDSQSVNHAAVPAQEFSGDPFFVSRFTAALTPIVRSSNHQSLLQRHRPTRIQDFIGLEKAREFLTALAENPVTTSLLFVGDSGVGKSTLAHAFAAAIPAQPHPVPARTCNQQRVEELVKECHYVPSVDWRPVSAHVGIIDEADAMTTAAQIAFLSVLDGTTEFPSTVIFIFTANSTTKLEPRFLSRCHVVEFTCRPEQVEEHLANIWTKEGRSQVDAPDFAKIVRDSGGGNVRSSINLLEMELLCPRPRQKSLALGGTEPHSIEVTFVDADSCEIHPLAKLIPEMDGQQYLALRFGISQHGVTVPIVRFEGKILDGRGRLRACRDFGIKCPVREYTGTDPVGELISLNAVRRNLNTSQRAMLAARIANLRHGGDRRSKHQGANLQLDRRTIRRSAQLLNVSAGSVAAAKRVLSEGNPDLVAAVDSGEVTVSSAAKSLDKPELTPTKISSARWLLRQLILIERSGIVRQSPRDLFLAMTESEQAAMSRIAPPLSEWLRGLARK